MSLRNESSILSAEAMSTKVNQALPVFISSKTLQDLPKLAVLLDDLSAKLDSRALLSSTLKELNNASAFLKHARRSFLEKSALLHYAFLAAKACGDSVTVHQLEEATAISKLALTLNIKPTEQEKSRHALAKKDYIIISDGTFSSSSEKSASVFNSSDSYHSTASNDQASSLKQPTLDVALHSKPDFIRDPLEYETLNRRVLLLRSSRLMAQKSSLIHELLNDYLPNVWRTLMPVLSPVTGSADECSASDVLEYVKSLHKKIKAAAFNFSTNAVVIHALLLQVENQLVEYGTLMMKLVENRRLSQHSLSYLQNLATTLLAHTCKLRSVELYILCLTYAPETVTSLKAMSLRLTGLLEKAEQDIAVLKQKLAPYAALDHSYKSLLDTYDKLRADINFIKATRR